MGMYDLDVLWYDEVAGIDMLLIAGDLLVDSPPTITQREGS